jgi:hypothetical protein
MSPSFAITMASQKPAARSSRAITDGIEKYLSSGMIRGVGPVYAKKLVRAFGEKVFDVIEATPDRLREVDGTVFPDDDRPPQNHGPIEKPSDPG